jgi:predicted acylesterase/phospholipase RssA
LRTCRRASPPSHAKARAITPPYRIHTTEALVRGEVGRKFQLMPVAFVLSGGASFGAAQAGMLQALYEREIRPDLVVGTSVGAINAAFIASRAPTVRTAHNGSGGE